MGKRGRLVLFTTRAGTKAAELQAWARANGVAELAVPRDIRVVEALPVLGTGKVDNVTLGAMTSEGGARAA